MIPIDISCEIDGISGQVKNILDANALNQHSVNLSITSRGGSYIEGLQIFNDLMNSKKKVNVTIPSYAMSAGALIALSGSHVSMAENALLMFHEARVKPDNSLTAEQMLQQSERIKVCNETLVNSIVGRTGMTREKCEELLKKESYLTAKEAKELKFVDEIIPITRRNKDISNFGLPEMILNQVKEVEQDMTKLLDVANKLGLKTATDENAEQEILNFVETLKPKPKHTLPRTVGNMIAKTRKIELDNLVATGKIIPAVAKKFSDEFTNVDKILNSIDEEGNVSDTFDITVSALADNDAVLSYEDKSGIQIIPKHSDKDKTVLAEEMKKLAERKSN